MPAKNTKRDQAIEELQTKLSTEHLSNTSIESYSVKNFVELDALIETANNGDFIDEVRMICREHLKEVPESISALYLVGAISLQESAMDDSYLPLLIKLFLEQKKTKIVRMLCEKILVYREHKYALRTLEQIYTEVEDQEALFSIKKRLVLVDSHDAVNAKYLGEYFEKEDTDLAMFYYRLAIERFIATRNLKMIEDIWVKIIALYPEDTKLIILIAKKIREGANDEYVAGLVFNYVVKNLLRDEKFKTALPIVKLCVSLHPTDKTYRKAIEDCYREIYKGHQQLEHYLKASAVGQSWKPYREAIRFFETHIAFDEGSYVYHKSWGIGQVKLIEKERVVVSFQGKEDHEMSLKIALRALTVLDENHILLWKAQKPEELKIMLEKEPLAVIELIMRSNELEDINSKDLKEIIVPELLSDKEWTKWWAAAKKSMDSSNTIVPSLLKRNVIELRDTERSVIEELISRFKKTTSFDNKVSVALNFIDRGGDINTSSSASIKNHFIEVLNAASESVEKKVLSLAVLRLAKIEGLDENILDMHIINGIKHFSDFYIGLSADLQLVLLRLLQKRSDWATFYADLILKAPLTKNQNFMLEELVAHDKWEQLNTVIFYIFGHFQEKPELFIWLARHALEDLHDELQSVIKTEELVLRMLTLVDILNSDNNGKVNSSKNKKLLTNIEDFLFKRGLLEEVVQEANEATAHSIYALVSSSITLDKTQKDELLEALNRKYPKFATIKQPTATVIKTRYPFLVTKESYENKRRDLENLVNIEIPTNSKAIGEAMEKGDLRENAEYKAALEKQDQLKAALRKLETDLGQAKIINRDEVSIDSVDVGTKVTLMEEKDGQVTYQILDPWAVNFDKGIISYHSPLGHTLLDKIVGDKVRFEFNGEVKNFQILAIELADFE